MTRAELHELISPILDILEDLGLDDQMQQLAELEERLMTEGIEQHETQAQSDKLRHPLQSGT